MSAGLTLERHDRVALLEFNRPEKRNSLTNEVLRELVGHLNELDADAEIRAVVITGTGGIFASGADLRDLMVLSPSEVLYGERPRNWDSIRRTRKPLIAAVSGMCLGGGCELALMCDIVVASQTARFGLPETGLGLIPGAGGTQRLVRAIGKAKAMEVVLAGRLLTAAEAESAGLVARVSNADEAVSDALEVGKKIALRSPTAVALAKEAVRASFETSLEAGLELERKSFAVAFGSPDAYEGIAAFLEKRDPVWTTAETDAALPD
jgi:enoyl-CoA hydratase